MKKTIASLQAFRTAILLDLIFLCFTRSSFPFPSPSCARLSPPLWTPAKQARGRRGRLFKFECSALSSRVMEGDVVEEDKDDKDDIRFVTLESRFENKETVLNR